MLSHVQHRLRTLAVTAAALLALGLSVGVRPASGEEAGERRASFEAFGPLQVPDSFALTQGFLSSRPRSGRVAERGRGQMGAILTVSNTWAMSSRVEARLAERSERAPLSVDELRELDKQRPEEGLHHADAELHSLTLSGRFGLGRRMELQVELPILDYGGSWTDSLIEDFHDFVGTSQSGRLGVPRHGHLIYVSSPDGLEVVRERPPSTQVGDLRLGLAAAIAGRTSSRWDAALCGRVKLPTGDEHSLQGSGSVDFGAALAASWWFRRSALHADAGLTWLGDHELFELDDQITWHANLVWQLGMSASSSLLLQAHVSASPLADLRLETYDDVVGNILVGVRLRPSERLSVEVAVSENVISLGNTMDIAFHVGLTGRW